MFQFSGHQRVRGITTVGLAYINSSLTSTPSGPTETENNQQDVVEVVLFVNVYQILPCYLSLNLKPFIAMGHQDPQLNNHYHLDGKVSTILLYQSEVFSLSLSYLNRTKRCSWSNLLRRSQYSDNNLESS